MHKDTEAGASLVEYVMLLAFVAVIGIIGIRALGPAAAGLFEIEALGTGTTSPPAEVLGIAVERVTIGTAIILERPPVACQDGVGSPVRPTCPR